MGSKTTTTTGTVLGAALLLLLLTLAPVAARDAFLYNRDTNRFVVAAQPVTVTGVSAPIATSTSYHWDRRGEAFSARATYADGTTYAYGYSLPRPYVWQCFGNGCSRAPYLHGLRTTARNPPPAWADTRAYTYGYVSHRTYW
jgi:hypothetical protein